MTSKTPSGEEALSICQGMASTTTTCTLWPGYTTTAYMAESEPLEICPRPAIPPGPSISTNGEKFWVAIKNAETEENDEEFYLVRDEKEIRQLLTQTLLWLGGMGEYPEKLIEIYGELAMDAESENCDDRTKVAERCVAKVLLWVLGEIGDD